MQRVHKYTHSHTYTLQEQINTGLFHMTSTCRRCHGQGRVITTPCRQCSGKGTTTRTQTVNVQVPAGVEDGQTVRVPVGHSEAYVELKVGMKYTSILLHLENVSEFLLQGERE